MQQLEIEKGNMLLQQIGEVQKNQGQKENLGKEKLSR